MTELQLYKFINNHNLEWHWDYHIDGKHLILFIPYFLLPDFCDLLGPFVFDDGGLSCDQRLCYDGSIGLARFEDVCEYFDINAEDVFPKEDEK